ncbi:AP2-like ethylene-responsive transcription factor [Chloropicon roscoffensis]|uniref:AP2-like ethylene-responsive transcription factor n=1 Tax=Chloropicon roscoffensis TaxID=1461544 RepID=A0AAX4PDE6_9CHLO
MEVPFQVSPLTVHDIMSYAVPQKTSLDASSVSGDDPAHQPPAAAAPTTLGEKMASVVRGQSATILQAHHHCNHALASKVRRREPLPQKRGRRGPLSRSSLYRGVTFYRRTSRWEAHVWTNGKQQYLGGYKDEEIAAKVYDKAVIKIRGKDADTNFPAEEYAEEMREMRASEVSVGEFICLLRSEAKRQNKLRREAEGRDTSDSSNPYGESLRLKSCRTWLSRTLGQGPPPLAGLATPSPALVTTATAQNPTAAAQAHGQLHLQLLKCLQPSVVDQLQAVDAQIKQMQLVEQLNKVVQSQRQINLLVEQLLCPLGQAGALLAGRHGDFASGPVRPASLAHQLEQHREHAAPNLKKE